MDLLKVENGQAFLCLNDEEPKIISQVTTDDISKALEVILETGEIGLALDEEPSSITNPAQKIIFEQLRSSFKEVLDSRDSIQGEVDRVFAPAEAMYFQPED